MDWIAGLQNALDYIEDHLTEPIDYEAVAAQSFCSSYHFQRLFSLLCGCTLGEYIRDRRLSLAGMELAAGDAKVIDVALKYGYDSPDSFARAFRKFHGILPSQARRPGSKLRSCSRLAPKFSLEGGAQMEYRIEKKSELILTGFKAHFTGAPYGPDRERQEEELFVTTRGRQWFLRGAAGKNTDAYCVISNITEDGYDYSYCHLLDVWERENLYDHAVTGVDFIESLGLETVVVPAAAYLVFETSDVKDPISEYFALLKARIPILTQWLPEMGFRLKPAPELAVYHWCSKSERSVQIWMPVERA